MSAEDQLRNSISQLTVLVGRLTTKTDALEERLAQAGQRGRQGPVVACVVPHDKLLKPSQWEAVNFSSTLQRRVFIEDLTKHFGKRMMDATEPTRDYYELKSLMEILELELEQFAGEARSEDAVPEGVVLKKLKHIVKRSLLLKEKTENGVESMKALERRLEDQGYEAEFETAIKEVRQRQLQAALQRTGSRVDNDSSLPRTQKK